MGDSYLSEGFADFYDVFIGSLPAEFGVGEDIGFYKRYLKEADRVLDLATGTGRVLGGLGVSGVGVDYSMEMLNKARKMFPDEKYSWVQGALSDYDVSEKFELVVVAAGSVCHIGDNADMLSFLDITAERVAPSGWLIVDLLPEGELPWGGVPGKLGEPLVCGDFTRTHIDARVTHSEGETLYTDTFELTANGKTFPESWTLRTTNPSFFVKEAERRGLVLKSTYDSWTATEVPPPVEDCGTAKKWIFVFEKTC